MQLPKKAAVKYWPSIDAARIGCAQYTYKNAGAWGRIKSKKKNGGLRNINKLTASKIEVRISKSQHEERGQMLWTHTNI